MLVYRVEQPLVCTHRLGGLAHQRLLVLRDEAGAASVATDPVGAREGNYVYTTTGTAARWAMGDYDVLTDLAVCGIIDNWNEESETNG